MTNRDDAAGTCGDSDPRPDALGAPEERRPELAHWSENRSSNDEERCADEGSDEEQVRHVVSRNQAASDPPASNNQSVPLNRASTDPR